MTDTPPQDGDTDHRADALANLGAALNIGGYPLDTDHQMVMARLVTAGVNALLDIGAQMRANAPVALEPATGELVQFAEMPIFPGPCPANTAGFGYARWSQ